MKRSTKKGLTILALTVVFMLIMICSLNFIEAFEFDNRLTYENNGEFDKLYIKNWLGAGATLATMELLENSDYCLDNCYAIIEVEIFNTESIFNKFDFINNQNTERDLEYKVYYEQSVLEDVTVYDVIEVCNDIVNKSTSKMEEVCYDTTIKSIEEIRVDKYVRYDGRELPSGTYKIKVEATKETIESIDWAFNYKGISSEEIRERWAWWSSYAYSNQTINLSNSIPLPINNNDSVDLDENGNEEWIYCMADTSSNSYIFYDDENVTACGTENWQGFMVQTKPVVRVEGSVSNISGLFMWTPFDDLVDNADNFTDMVSGRLIASVVDAQHTKAIMGERGKNGYDQTGVNGGIVTYGATTISGTNEGSFCMLMQPDINSDDGGYGTLFYGNSGATPRQTATFGAGETLKWYIGGTLVMDLENTNWFYANEFFHACFTWDDNPDNYTLWKNGSVISSSTTSATIASVDNFILGGRVAGTYSYNGKIYDFQAYNKTLTPTEVTALYNQATSLTAGLTSTIVVSISYPTNTTYSETSLNLNYTTDADSQCWYSKNLGVVNSTPVSAGTNWTSIVGVEGGNRWDVWCNDSTKDLGTDSVHFTVDTIDPLVNVTIPTQNQEFIVYGVPNATEINATVSDAGLDTCWYNNGTEDTIVTCGDNVTLSFYEGTQTVTWYANDTVNHTASSARTFFINNVSVVNTLASTIAEGSFQTIYLNISATNISQLSGSITYNGTVYASTASNNGLEGYLANTINTPLVTADSEISVTWNYSLNDIYYVTGVTNQTILNLPFEVGEGCSAGFAVARCWNFTDAQNDTFLNENINYNFKYGVVDNNANELYGSIDGILHFCLCINDSISNAYKIGYGEVQYEKTGWSDRRFYLFEDTILTNATINDTLYSLINGDSTSFLFTFRDSSLNVYDDKYVTLNRWYPEKDAYKVTEMGKTDEKGQTVFKIGVEDVDYRVGLYYKNGTLIHLTDPLRMVCLSSPCSYTITVPDAANDNWENYLGLDYTLVWNNIDTFTFTFSDSSQETSNIKLDVFRDRGTNNLLICSSNTSSYAGALECNISGYTGNLRAVGYRTASPEVPLATLLVDTASTVFQGTMGLFIAVIVAILLVLMGLISPVLTVILAVVALIPALIFGVLPLQILILLGVMGGIVIHFMKKSE